MTNTGGSTGKGADRGADRGTGKDSTAEKNNLADLAGTTAARSKIMTDEERRLMLLKRKIRNRESATRSRDVRNRKVSDLRETIKLLADRSVDYIERYEECVQAVRVLEEECRSLQLQREQIRRCL
eukprot:Plantae.Rhodophyta-Purpureofilum_apyrenoidigerum.ctg15893.p1 GENE.Plantae.Rhodophyta-Purpureofilum_apyrenoidigerum.ctg15893~~Plantae.Rhodophyta-Purpureofilum_apyrenoidigerum.ctg15893.p1  ORF type:complete len:135 (-),score=19.63 Plantae.Rhodophyta-Purpureofilum_apyrenoidigerum.ctg15893:515-892(-)